ncbi:MAG TPA: PH domain-containing protein, partial [Solirubrobacterales bacterium]|nr:PH domain-containing protein [Solirubrobacterales bacterium]
IKGIATTAVIALIVALVTGLGDGGPDSGLVSIIALVGVAVTILAGFIKRGIVSRTIQETRLERVQNVNYHQSVVQRMLQVGDVDFDTAAGDDYNFVFAGVDEPADVVHMVDEATRSGGNGIGDSEPTRIQAEPER